MKRTKLFFAALLGSVLFVSCDDDDTPINLPLGAYQGGFFVLNEGNAAAGSVSFSTYNYSLLKQDIYGAENEDDGLGGYVQSIFFSNEKAYIISSGSNKITIVNRYTFQLIGKIETGFSNPRYGAVYNGKAYVTNLGSFANLTDDYVSVIDLSDDSVEAPIPMGTLAEKIFVANDKLYVLNGSYGDGNSIKVINPETGAVDTTIPLPQSPNSYDIDNGKLYVLTGSSFAAPAPSHIVRINLANNAVENDLTFPAAMIGAQNLNIENGMFYFSLNNKIYDDAITATSIGDAASFTPATMNLYGMQIINGSLYLTDAKDYVSDGALLIYTPSGTLLKELATSLIPSSVYFN
jgi:hypothetical protein